MAGSQQTKVPRIARWIVQCSIHSVRDRSFLGDMDEFYSSRAKSSKSGAWLWYWAQAFRAIPSLLWNRFVWFLIMCWNYGRISVRHMKKDTLFTFINVLGLALSMSVCLFIIQFNIFFRDIDRFHKNADRIVRVTTTHMSKDGKIDRFARIPAPLYDAWDGIPGVKKSVTFVDGFRNTAIHKDRVFTIAYYFVEHEFFELFDFPLEKGSFADFNGLPNQAVITSSAADKFFPETDPIGQSLFLDDVGDVVIKGVLAPFSKPTHFRNNELFVSLSTFNPRQDPNKIGLFENWKEINSVESLLLLDENASIRDVEHALNSTIRSTYGEPVEEYTFQVQPLLSIVHGPELWNEWGEWFPGIINIIFSIVGFLILLTACLNYANLTHAKALNRLREIGIRKVVGGSRGQLFVQFMGEAVVFAFMALVLALWLEKLVVSLFLSMHPIFTTYFAFPVYPMMYVLFLIFAVFTGLLAGFLPAAHLSRMRPVVFMRGKSGLKLMRIGLQKTFTVFQFTFSMIFLMATLAAFQQFRYVKQLDLGIRVENVIKIPIYLNRETKYQKLKAELENIPEVQDFFGSGYVLLSGNNWPVWIRKQGNLDSLMFQYIPIDPQYIPSLGIQMAAGTSFTDEMMDGRMHFVLVNETGAKLLGFQTSESALGNGIQMRKNRSPRILGVVKDFMIHSFVTEIKPLLFVYNTAQFNYLFARVDPGNWEKGIESVEAAWKRLFPTDAFTYELLEDEITENNLVIVLPLKMGAFVSILAITIACMGILGMAMYYSRARQKEVGIRKVMGAREDQLVIHLSRGFFVLLGISIIISIPPVWMGAHAILNLMAHHADLNAWVFIGGIGIILVFGLLPILTQTVRAARTNPAEVLRNE